MCQLKALAITKEQCTTDFKATYTASVSSSCRQAGADSASSREWCGLATANDAQHPHTALASTCVTLTIATTYVQRDAFLQANLFAYIRYYFRGNEFLVNHLQNVEFLFLYNVVMKT